MQHRRSRRLEAAAAAATTAKVVAASDGSARARRSPVQKRIIGVARNQRRHRCFRQQVERPRRPMALPACSLQAPIPSSSSSSLSALAETETAADAVAMSATTARGSDSLSCSSSSSTLRFVSGRRFTPASTVQMATKRCLAAHGSGGRSRPSSFNVGRCDNGAPIPTAVPGTGAGQMIASSSLSSSASARQQQPNRHESLLADEQQKLALERNKMDLIKEASRVHQWHWNDQDKSEECLVSKDNLEVCFHPQTSASAAAIRGSAPLIRNGNYYYWEITAFDKTYGTSVMFGLCTKQQQLHLENYCNLIGLDENGWSLSHKGYIWHDGKATLYTRMFPTNQTVTVGLLFNTMRGELSFFMNGKSLGVAFRGLNDVDSELYPVIGSTAKCTRMRLIGAYCGYVSLLERSCFTLLKSAPDKIELVKAMQQYQVPKNLIEYLAEAAEVCGSQTENTAKNSINTIEM